MLPSEENCCRPDEVKTESGEISQTCKNELTGKALKGGSWGELCQEVFSQRRQGLGTRGKGGQRETLHTGEMLSHKGKMGRYDGRLQSPRNKTGFE